MSLKLKLISCISAFVLVLGLLFVGVFAANQGSVQMGGSLSFTATDVYARVTGEISGAGVGDKTLPAIEFSASNENPDQSGWQNLDLEFNATGEPITIEVMVENLATDRSLTVNLKDNFSSEQGGLIKDVKNGDSEYTGSNVVLNASTGSGTSTTTFTITLSLSSKNNSLSDTAFGYTINLYDASYEFPVKEITDFSFSTNDDGTATLTSYMGTDTNVVIPSSFSIQTIDLGVAGYTETFNNMDEFTAYTNNQYNQTILMSGFYYMTTPLTERTFVTNFESYFAELDTLAGGDMTKLFPMTIETTDYEMTYENFTSLGEVGQRGIMKPLYDVMFGNVGGVTMEFSSDEKYDIDATNVMEMGNEISSSMANLTENSFPIKVSYPTEKTMYVEGDDCTLTSIGDSAFYNCDGLTSITIPESVTTIGAYAFRDCSGLTSVDLSGCTRLTTIGNYAFYNCSSLTSVDLSGCTRLTTIGFQAFYDCSSLTSVTFGENGQLTTIDDYAFRYCSGLTSITLPSRLTTIGHLAFDGCSGLETITVEEGNTIYHSDGNCLIETASGTLIQGCNNSVIPQNGSVTSIGDYAFYGCSGLTSIDLSGCTRLTSIGDSAFYGCSGLTSITIPESVTSIGSSAFRYCSGLTSITLPSSLESIGNNAFYECSGLTSIDLSGCTSLTSIGGSAFYGCSGLTSITIPEGVTSIGYNVFFNCSGLESITFNTPYSWQISSSSSFSSILATLDASSVQANALTYLTDTYDDRYWRAVV